MFFTHWVTKSQLTLGLSRAHFPQLEGRSAGRREWVYVSGKTTVFYEFLGHSHLSAVVRLPSSPSSHPPQVPSTTLTKAGESVRCVLYVKSMVLGLCESKSRPVVKTNFVYHSGLLHIIITPAQQLRLWIHNQTKVGRTVCPIWFKWIERRVEHYIYIKLQYILQYILYHGMSTFQEK